VGSKFRRLTPDRISEYLSEISINWQLPAHKTFSRVACSSSGHFFTMDEISNFVQTPIPITQAILSKPAKVHCSNCKQAKECFSQIKSLFETIDSKMKMNSFCPMNGVVCSCEAVILMLSLSFSVYFGFNFSLIFNAVLRLQFCSCFHRHFPFVLNSPFIAFRPFVRSLLNAKQRRSITMSTEMMIVS
jgi:hypothetical protein